jgi:hypothetical protein
LSNFVLDTTDILNVYLGIVEKDSEFTILNDNNDYVIYSIKIKPNNKRIKEILEIL